MFVEGVAPVYTPAVLGECGCAASPARRPITAPVPAPILKRD